MHPGEHKKRQERDWEEELASGEPLDLIQICIRDLKFHFSDGSHSFLLQIPKLEVAQGCIVAVTGPHRGGKTTFLKLLANILNPKSGLVFIPPHLKVLHVTQDPILLEDSLWNNITFGAVDEPRERVLAILQRMHCDEALEMLMEEAMNSKPAAQRQSTYFGGQAGGNLGGQEIAYELEGSPMEGGSGAAAVLSQSFITTTNVAWMARLSATEHALVHIARAFVVNPEVLVIHRPTLRFNEDQRTRIMELLAQFVDERGIEGDTSGPMMFRRPRTCFFTSDFPEKETRWAHKVWEVNSGVVRELDVGRYK